MKRIILVMSAILLVATAVNYFSGTTITINGHQITDVGEYIATYLILLLLSAVLVFVIPSILVFVTVLVIVLGLLGIAFLPVLPVAFLLLPGVVFVGIVWLIYKAAKRK